VIYQTDPEAQTVVIGAPQKRTLALAILAPFGVIALMASPLLVDAIRHAVGV
jgi:hypothetical protein